MLDVGYITARSLGLPVGVLPTGPLNAITDVAGVRVGHCTLDSADQDIHTGVTAILPHAGNIYREKVTAAVHVINGFGKSIGLMQDRTPYMRPYINDAALSSAYNIDIAYAIWRSCFEGAETWLNTVERGRDYAAGDAWGCMGRWFSGRWYTADALQYIARVQDYFKQRIWTTANFIHG